MERKNKEELMKEKMLLDELQETIKKLGSVIENMKQSEVIKQYLDIKKEYEDITEKINFLNQDLKEQEFLNCYHYFVVNKKERDEDDHVHCTVTCIHCGLTNQYMEWSDEILSPQQRMMNHLFIEYQLNYFYPSHGTYSKEEIPVLKEIYDNFKKEYPNTTDEDAEKHIAYVKNLKGGKLC